MSEHLPFKPVFHSTGEKRVENQGRTFFSTQTAFLWLTIAHLSLLPWAIGTVHVWSQILSLLLSGTGVTLALWPDKTTLPNEEAAPRQGPWQTLLRSPAFWLGTLFLTYILIQALNPAWRHFDDGNVWWLETVDHLRWLPAGVDAPFSISNPWRQLLVFTSLFFLVLSLWFGVRSRTSLRAILWALTINGALLSLFGIFQKLSGTYQMFWLWRPSTVNFFATFIYPNQAGAYLNLIFALTTGFSLWHLRRAARGSEGAGTAGVLGFLAVLTGIGVFLTTSRLSILVLTAQLLGFAGFLVSQRQRNRQNMLPILFAVALAAGLGALLVVPNQQSIVNRFAQVVANPTETLRSRSVVHRATAEMAADRWIIGWGAGCFQHAFPLYAQKYPELCTIGAGKTLRWEHAHSDPLELLAELGAIGSAPIAFVALLVVAAFVRLRFWHDPVCGGIVLGACALVAHSFGDLIFQSPAVLFSWAAAVLIALRWRLLDQPRAASGSGATTSSGRGSI